MEFLEELGGDLTAGGGEDMDEGLSYTGGEAVSDFGNATELEVIGYDE